MFDTANVLIKHIKTNVGEFHTAWLTVLRELKTKESLERNEITDKMQLNWLQKMLKDRVTSYDIYIKAGRTDRAQIEDNERKVICEIINEISLNMPPEMSESNIKKIMDDYCQHMNIGEIMKFFIKNYPDVNKAVIAKLIKK